MTVQLDWEGDDPEVMAEKLENFGPRLADRLEDVLDQAVLRVQANAQRNVAVDTGRLRASIGGVVERLAGALLEGKVGSNVSYARFVESDQPYLRPAVESIWPWLRREVITAVRETWDSL